MGAAQAGQIVTFALGDWPPFTSSSDPNGKVLERLVAAAYAAEGMSVHYEYFPWKRSYVEALHGDFDGTFPWTHTPDRDRDFLFNAVPLVQDDTVFFHLRSHPFHWNTLSDLKQYRIGVTIGYKEEAMYQAAGIPADSAATETTTFRKLLGGRIDAYATSERVGGYTVAKEFGTTIAAEFTTDPKPLLVDEYYVMFSRATPRGRQLADALDDGLRRLKQSGAYDTILAGRTVAIH